VFSWLLGGFLFGHFVDLRAQIDGQTKELVDGNVAKGPIGKFVLNILLQAEQEVQFFFARGDGFLLQELESGFAEGLNLGGEIPVPIDKRSLGNMDFSGNVAQTPALGAQFDELVLSVSG